MEMVIRLVVESLAALTMVGGLVGLLVERLRSKKPVEARTVQLTAVVFIVPAMIILALEDVLNTETVAALLGALIGFALGGLSREAGSSESPSTNR